MTDTLYRKWSGETCYRQDGRPIMWRGHLCEGANLTAPTGRDFCLWTRCGQHDVPANEGHVGGDETITCARCREIEEAEEGRPVGSATESA